jgi:large subunit ribosomal protein L28
MLSLARSYANHVRHHAYPAVLSASRVPEGWSQAASSPLLLGNNNINNADQQVRWRSNRSRRGLYNGKDVGTGNNVSFSMKATKRRFKPNVFIKRVYSETLDDMIRFHLTASTLRSIDKAGGLDNYLFDPKRKIVEGEGYEVKKKILKRRKNLELLAAKAQASAPAPMSG